MKNLFLIFCFFSLAATCQDQNSTSVDSKENPCPPDVICTMEFRVLKLQIVDQSGSPVQLDSYYTEFSDFNVTIDEELTQLEEGNYPVATDGEMDSVDFEGKVVTFIGIKNGSKIVEHKMVIGKDCCHIILVEGEQKITI
ncbi:hypothetical protein SAMN05661096_01712 [Marivirga sericea]|uniref:Uncharacterized protein n=1 Tax=Marivirga sericea TaxID=1028 RepID=A0A1X7JLK1_9BACT|nr:hypothetical protein [Marivirga sericea]SMG28498.1 hypothetical protein SAMN05661096_01712 [Marivirga sericea]